MERVVTLGLLLLVSAVSSQDLPPRSGAINWYQGRTVACPVKEDLNASVWWEGVMYSSFSEACQRSSSLHRNCHRACVEYSSCPRVHPYPLPAVHNSTFWWTNMRFSNFSEACHMSQSLRDKCHRECVIAINADLVRLQMEQEDQEKEQAREMMRRMMRRSRIAGMTGLSMQMTSLMVSTISMIIALIRFILSFTSAGGRIA